MLNLEIHSYGVTCHGEGDIVSDFVLGYTRSELF